MLRTHYLLSQPHLYRELLELYNAAHQRGESTSTEDLLDLLVIKDQELKDTMQIGF